MKRALFFVTLAVLTAGCAAASGYDPKRYAHVDAGAPDPETTPLPPQPRTTIPDPKHPAPPGPAAEAPDAGATK
jgi:hypothetical protein